MSRHRVPEALGISHLPFAVALISVLAASESGCRDESTTAPPCTVGLASEAAQDLVLRGEGACARIVRLELRVATGDPAAPVWSKTATAPLRVDGAWTLEAGAAVRTVRVTNASDATVTLVGLEWSSADLAGSSDRLLHAGYQSWSYAGVEPIPGAHDDHLGTAPHGGDGEDPLGEVPGVSWWYGALSDANGAGVVFGATGATVLKTYGAADGARLRIVQGLTGDSLTLAAGETRVLDGLYVRLGNVAEGLEAYAAHVASLHPAVVARRAPLGGWGSWNVYYANPTAAALREEMAWAKGHLAPLGLHDILLDDGYESRWGAWSAGATFGASLDALAAEQAASDLAPAIWVAPFYVDRTDPVVAAHPSWFVHRSDGNLRSFSNLGGGTYAALDVTDPGARAFTVEQLRTLRRWGYRNFKLDFLFGGAVEGVRARSITALESYALWFRAIREALPDAHLVGCGAPILPTVGWVDSMRTGADIAFGVAPEPTFSFTMSRARSTVLRAFTDAWWAVDPDVVLLRGGRLTDAEAWTSVVSAAMMGGNYLLGDGRQAGDLRAAMALDASVIAMTRDSVAARPLDLMAVADPMLYPSPLLVGSGEMAVPHVWRKGGETAQARWIAVFGWQSDPSFATELDLPSGALEIVPPTAPDSGATPTPIEGRRRIEVEGHAARLFRLPRAAPP